MRHVWCLWVALTGRGCLRVARARACRERGCLVCGGVLEAREGYADAPPYTHRLNHSLYTDAQPSFTSTHPCPRSKTVSTNEPQAHAREGHGHADVAEDKISSCQKIQIVYLLVCHNPGVHRCVLCCVYAVLVLLFTVS